MLEYRGSARFVANLAGLVVYLMLISTCLNRIFADSLLRTLARAGLLIILLIVLAAVSLVSFVIVVCSNWQAAPR